MNAALTQFRQFVHAASALLECEEITVPCAAALLKKKPEWVRANLPVIVHGPKCHHVRLVDIKAYQDRRTLLPKKTERDLSENHYDRQRIKAQNH